MIVAGATAYPRRIDAEPFRAIADEVGALLMFDAAHIAGLIAGGAHPSPVRIADVVTLTTHKTLRGPRGGAILCHGRARGRGSTRPSSPGSRAGRSSTSSPAKAVAFREAHAPVVQRLRRPDRGQRRRARRGPRRARASASSPAAPTTT